MKITNVNNNTFSPNKETNPKVKADEKERQTPAAIYEKSKPEEKTHVYNKVTIDQLKKDADKHYENLKRMVEDLLHRQGKTFNDLHPEDVVEVDETTRTEASKLIGEDGPLGIEAMSDKIVDFAKAISGSDTAKLDTIKKAIDQGFKEAEKILGELPEISRQTYDRVMEKLDAWDNE